MQEKIQQLMWDYSAKLVEIEHLHRAALITTSEKINKEFDLFEEQKNKLFDLVIQECL
jgi:hypothetical protein